MNESAVAGDAQRVVLGRVSGAFGVTGWVKVLSYTDPSANILDYKSWQLRTRNGGWQTVELIEGREVSKGIQARLEGITDRDAAAELRGIDIAVWRSELPNLAAGEHYWEDLLDLEVFTPEGELLGKVDHFSETAAHPLLIVRGEREHWIPLVKGRIKNVDTVQRRVVVDWGLDW
jgi:16S rRNA processing protein RimM